MEFSLRRLGFIEFLLNNNHQAVNKICQQPDNYSFVKKLHETLESQSKFHGIKYINLIYICLLLLLLLL